MFIHPGSAYFKTLPQFIIAGEIVQTSRLYARSVSPLDKMWLDDISPDLYPRLTALVKQGSARVQDKEEKQERRDREEERGKSTVMRNNFV